MNGALGEKLGKRGDREKRCGEKKSSKKMGIGDGVELMGLHGGAFALMSLHLELGDSLFGSQSAVAPSFPTAVDFFASLPDAAPLFATTNRPLFPQIPRLLDSTEILAFLSSHHPHRIDMKKNHPSRMGRNVVPDWNSSQARKQ
jgi:hypothetical protein